MQHSITRERWEGETIEEKKIRAYYGQLTTLEICTWIHNLQLIGT